MLPLAKKIETEPQLLFISLRIISMIKKHWKGKNNELKKPVRRAKTLQPLCEMKTVVLMKCLHSEMWIELNLQTCHLTLDCNERTYDTMSRRRMNVIIVHVSNTK